MWSFDYGVLERIDDSGVIPSDRNGGYNHTRIVRVPARNSPHTASSLLAVADMKFRTKVRHDASYDFQSSYTVEVWNPSDLAWHEVCRWVGGDAHVKTFNLPRVHDNARDLPKAETAVARLVEWMTDIAVQVVS